jgi:hypothetical protein
VVTWIATADDWTQNTAYEELDEEAGGLDNDLEANWNAVKGSSGSEPNGVDQSYP